MYIIQLDQVASKNAGIYFKRGIMVFRNIEEHNQIMSQIQSRLAFSRKRRIRKAIDLNQWLPTSVQTPMTYIEYRYTIGSNWEQEIVDILKT